MVRGGSNKKPAAVHLLQGTHRADRHNGKKEPRPRPVRPTCPSWLSAEAMAEWRRIAPELERLGLLTALDRAALSAYCQAWANWRACEETIGREGLVSAGHRGVPRKHPLLPAAARYVESIRMWCAELGLTPLSRTRLSVTVPADEASDLDDLLD